MVVRRDAVLVVGVLWFEFSLAIIEGLLIKLKLDLMVKISTNSSSTSIIAANFHALSDSLRIAILELLRDEELCVCELCDRLEVPQSKLSFHLKILKDVSLVRARQEGRWMYYSLNVSKFATLQEYLGEFQLLTPRQPGRTASNLCG